MDPNDREDVLFSTLDNNIPNSMRYRVTFSFHSCNYGIFIVWHAFNTWTSMTTNAAGRRAVLQTLEKDADDVDDGGLWLQQHGVIAHTA